MKRHSFGLVLVLGAAVAGNAAAKGSHEERSGAKPWCAPEVTELSNHVCFYDGENSAKSERHTLVIYLHGMLATTPGFQYLQQRAMAIHAKRNGVTVLMPTAPLQDNSYAWPNSVPAQTKFEADVLSQIQSSRAALENKMGRHFDDTFVVGFSSGAYYASSLAARGVLDVDGYAMFAGGSPLHAKKGTKPVPVFVGVSASDRQTAGDSRSLANSLGGWPHRVEERPVGHLVDGAMLAHAISWLRNQVPKPSPTANL
jgi:predicted esterase